jgi:hypothetical protein
MHNQGSPEVFSESPEVPILPWSVGRRFRGSQGHAACSQMAPNSIRTLSRMLKMAPNSIRTLSRMVPDAPPRFGRRNTIRYNDGGPRFGGLPDGIPRARTPWCMQCNLGEVWPLVPHSPHLPRLDREQRNSAKRQQHKPRSNTTQFIC